MNTDSTPVRLLQITDTHLYAEPEKELYGVDTRSSLSRVLAAACRRPKPDLVLATGDLVHDESLLGYQTLAGMFELLKAPVAAIAGNHDALDILRTVAGKNFRIGGSHRLPGWRIVLLNTMVPGETHGHLQSEELDFLEDSLAQAGKSHVLVALHHQPVAVGCAWLDRIGVSNADDFFRILDRYTCVRAILWGHVHQAFEAERRGVLLLSTPSTCAQFRPDSRDFALDDKPPGMRWLTLHPDGHIETRIEWVAE
ncbi:MAG: 3',5'-cyclic-AMP phosphodiesterase [Gammaproteobacteria bacterium]|nr:3',5'-cyclic-AMP phosphodiesterase [Gammaproteobacteria bacterium]MDE2346725.1 3',5'-cyclic-AMP phosphodiesterase [Gammaproteobacteria bacterium]